MAADRAPLRAAALLLALIAVSACGQKGPLRMPAPEPETKAQPTPTPPTTVPAKSDDPTSLEARRRNPHE